MKTRERKKAIFLFLFTCTILITIDFIAGQKFIPNPMQVLDVADPIRVKNSYFHHGMRPNYKARESLSQHTFTTYTNSLGCRDAEIRSVAKDTPGRKRILFMGDSFVEGIGVDFEKTFVGIIRQSLQDDYEVLNGGSVSYSPLIYHLRTKYLLEVEQLKIDRVFCFIDTTDAYDEYLYQVLGKFKPQPRQTFMDFLSNNVLRRLNRNLFTFWSVSTIYQYNKAVKLRRGTEYWTRDERLFNSFGKQGLTLGANNMEKLISLCRQHDIPITLVVYPWPYMIQARDVNSIQSSFWTIFAKGNNIDIIDLFPVFINNKMSSDSVINTYFLQNDNHWNEAGHQLVSRYILQYLVKADN